MMWLAAVVASGLGAVLRYVVDSVVVARVHSRVPAGTLVVNVSGSFVAGLIVGAASSGYDSTTLGPLVGIALLGSYTTFSTAMVESVTLARSQRGIAAAANTAGMLVLSIAAAALGFALTG